MKRVTSVFIAVFLLAVYFIFASYNPAQAAALTWDGGCGADTNWSCDNNWSTNTEPASTDTVTFNTTSTNNSTVDSTFGGVIAGVTISSGYTGTITMERSLQITGAFSQAAGSFTAASQTLDMDSSFTLSAGTFTASSVTVTLAGAMTISGSPTFSHNSGTWTFDGTTTASLACNNVTFNSVTFANTSGTKTVNSTCSLPLGANPTTGTGGDISVSGTLSGSGTLTIGASGTASDLTVGTTGVLSGFTGIVTNGDLNVTGGILNAGSFTTLDVNDAFTVASSGVFTAPSGTMTVAGSLTINSGTTFTHNSGTVNLDGTSGTITCTGTPFNLVVLANTSSSKTIAAGCTVPLGTNTSSDKSLVVSGTITGSGSLTFTAGTLTFSAGGAITGFSTLTTSALTVSGSGTVNLGGLTSVDVNGVFTLGSPAVLVAPPTLTAATTFTINSGSTFTHNSGTVIFDGTANSAITCNSASFNLVKFAHTTGTKTVTSTCSLPLGSDSDRVGFSPLGITLQGTLSGTGTLSFASGTTLTVNNASAALSGFTTVAPYNFTATNGVAINLSSFAGALDITNNFLMSTSGTNLTPPATMYVGGNFTMNSGTTFTHNNGTVILDGENPTVNASTTFYNFTKINTAAGGILFTGGVSNTIAGTLTLKGTSVYYLGLASTNTTAWTINPQGSRDIQYVSVSNSTNSNATAISALNSLNNSGNTNWSFTAPSSSSGNSFAFTDTTSTSGLGAYMTGVYSHTSAWGDANGDGNLDLFVGDFTVSSRPDGETPAPNQLFLGNSSGGFTKSDQSVLAVYAQASGAAFVDLDNDGDQDLIVSNYWKSGNADPKIAQSHLLYRNAGNGTYEDISVASGIQSAGPDALGRTVSIIDYNNDGFMDILMHGDALTGNGEFRLVKNNGNMTFSNVTAAAELPTDFSGLGVSVGDANGDTYPDFIISGAATLGSGTDGYREFRLYINDKDGTFHESTPSDFSWSRQGTGHDDWTAGAAWGDLNNDGKLDLITGQHFESSYKVGPLTLRIYMNQGNESDGDPTFTRMSLDTLAPIASKQPHMEIQDFDNDGWADIFVSVLVNDGGSNKPYVYRNSGSLNGSGNPSFIMPDYDYQPRTTGLPYYSPGAPVADYDNDGKIDVFMEGLDVYEVPSLWRNTTSTSNNWLKVQVTRSDNTQGIGSRIKVYTAGHANDTSYLLGLREIDVGSGFTSARPSIAHFGLGSNTKVDVVVNMPHGGPTYIYTGITSNQLFTIAGPKVENTIVVDASPADKLYAANQRPTFRWKATTTTSTIKAYTLTIDNGSSGDFTVSGIPPTPGNIFNRLETSTYYVTYENFNDSDSQNNYVSLFTKTSSDWGGDSNDGKLKEGKRSWTLTAYDGDGNSVDIVRTLYVDLTAPEITSFSLGSLELNPNQTFYTGNLKPAVGGMITDELAGDTTASSIASAPRKMKVEFYRQSGANLRLTRTVEVFTDRIFEEQTRELIDNSTRNTYDKYGYFSTPLTVALPVGTYKVIVTASDIAGNEVKKEYKTVIGKSLREMQIDKEGVGGSSKKQKMYDVTITVHDHRGRPARGAVVTLHSTPRQATSDHKGLATFEGVERGVHTLTIAYGDEVGSQKLVLDDNVKKYDISVKVTKRSPALAPESLGINFIFLAVIIVLALRLRSLQERINKIRNK